MLGVMAARRASRSPYPTMSNPGVNGPKSSRPGRSRTTRSSSFARGSSHPPRRYGQSQRAPLSGGSTTRGLDGGLDGLCPGVHRQDHVFAGEAAEALVKLPQLVVVERRVCGGRPIREPWQQR